MHTTAALRLRVNVCLGCFALLSSGLFGCAGEPHPLTGQEAPLVRMPLLKGGTFDLRTHRGKEIVILDFWATWCGPCREYMPIIERVAEEFKTRGVVLYAVNSMEHPDTVRRYISAHPIQSPIALDLTGAASVAYAADFLPQTVIIDKNGQVRKVYVGVGGGIESTIRRDLERLVGSKSLPSASAE